MTFPNIALTGAIRAGKSSVSEYLTRQYGYTEFAFGDALKHLAHEVFDVPKTPKPRELYQTFGQWCREREPDMWVRKCFDNIAWSEDVTRVVLSDVRQPNEFSRCRAEGYVIIRVKAPSAIRIHRAIESADKFAMGDLTHETESHVDTFAVDYEIINDGTLAELYAKVDAIMGGIERRPKRTEVSD